MSTTSEPTTELAERFALKALVESCLVLEDGIASMKDIDTGLMAGAGIIPPPFARADDVGLDLVLALGAFALAGAHVNSLINSLQPQTYAPVVLAGALGGPLRGLLAGVFGAGGYVLFLGEEKGTKFVYRVKEDGSDLQKVVRIDSGPSLFSASPDGK